MDYKKQMDFYKGKRVLVTGHTGFKGSWLCMLLKELGADVYGYALEPGTEPNLYTILGLKGEIDSAIGDIRDYASLEKAYIKAQPDVVIHLAAQPIVRDSYKNPRYTYETNVMGTVNILECVRKYPSAVSFLNVTTDKVYENNDIVDYAFRETDKLDGYDPYSNSKSCSELVTHSYKNSYFAEKGSPAISTVRAGNVIGGGDFANDRIIPDCIRAVMKGESIFVRNPNSIRPYQHVLDPLFAYLIIAMEQSLHRGCAGYFNIGPSEADCIKTEQLVDLFVEKWGDNAEWRDVSEIDAPHEACFLKLDCTKAKKVFGWETVWHASEAINKTVDWYKAWSVGENMRRFTIQQIEAFKHTSIRDNSPLL